MHYYPFAALALALADAVVASPILGDINRHRINYKDGHRYLPGWPNFLRVETQAEKDANTAWYMWNPHDPEDASTNLEPWTPPVDSSEEAVGEFQTEEDATVLSHLNSSEPVGTTQEAEPTDKPRA